MGYFNNKVVLVTGASGFLGQHLVGELKKLEVGKIVAVGSKDYDLSVETEVQKMFTNIKPNLVFHLAGLVGGILVNKERPGDFYYKNMMMCNLTFHYAYQFKADKFIGVGAGCGYPQFTEMPLKETALWDGPPQIESAPYSLAKRTMTIQGWAYHKQYGFNSVVAIPGNVYGEFDNFNLRDSHVIPALVRKFIEAKQAGKKSVEVWGSGESRRDYVYAGDVAQGLIRAAEVYMGAEVVNLSAGTETSVKEICELLRKIVGFEGDIVWQTNMPEGQKRRLFDVSKAKKDLGFTANTSLQAGLEKTVKWYLENCKSPSFRG